MRRPLAITAFTIFFICCFLFAGFIFYERGRNTNKYPQIECPEEDIHASVNITDEELLSDVRAYDAEDGDITSRLVVEKTSKFVEKGVSYVVYAVSDSARKVTKAQRRVVYTDYTSPRFSLTQPLEFLYGTKSFNLKDYIRAEDCFDGDISRNIKITTVGDVPSLYNVGVWTVKASVTNSMGDTATILLDVTVDEQNYTEKRYTPKITLKNYLIYLSDESEADFERNLQNVVIDSEKYNITSDIMKDIKITSNIDYNTPGTYKVNYMYTSKDGYTGNVNLIVVVTGDKNG